MKGLILFLLICVFANSLDLCSSFFVFVTIGEPIDVPLKLYSLENGAGVLLRVLYQDLPFPFVCDDIVVISESSDVRIFPIKEIQNSCVILMPSACEFGVQYSHTTMSDDGHCMLYESDIVDISLESALRRDWIHLPL